MRLFHENFEGRWHMLYYPFCCHANFLKDQGGYCIILCTVMQETRGSSIGQIWRAVQQTTVVSCSISSSQISYAGSNLRVKKMSRAGDRSVAVHGDKRMKVQKSIWRSVSARSHSREGKENEDTDSHIKSVQVECSSVANAKRWIVVNGNGKHSDSDVASISEVQNSTQDVETKSEAVADQHSSTIPIKSFISVKHIKSEDSVECIKLNQEGLNIESITLANLEDVPKSEQQESLHESQAPVKSVKESQGNVIIKRTATDHEKDSVEDKQQQREEDTDSKILQNCTAVEESVETSRHSSTVKVDAALLRFVKGKGGKVQQKIEDTTGVKLSFISINDENAVVVDGPSIENVTTAAAIIQNLLDEAVKGPNLQYSHFVSLPLAVHPALVEKLINFQNSILASSGYVGKEVIDSENASTVESSEEDSEESYEVKLDVEDGKVRAMLDLEGISTGAIKAKTQTFYSQAKKNLGIDKTIFIKPATFHLTVLMLKLWNNERVAAAAGVLEKVSSQVKEALEDRPVAVSLKGLEIMRGTPEKAHVLYVPVEEVGGGERLQHACRVIIDAFVEAGLVMQKDVTSALKIHATLMNTSHRKMKKFRRFRRNFPFNAQRVMELYGSENWGEYVIHEAHLSQRFKYDDNGYYHCYLSIPFPEINKESGDGTTETTEEIV